MTKDEALKLALEYVELVQDDRYNAEHIDREALVTVIKEALAQQEPVAWEQFYPEMGNPKLAYLPPTESPDNACYTPPQRTWVGLTDEEIALVDWESLVTKKDLVKAIEAKLKEKNT